jgi:hypothetical protein
VLLWGMLKEPEGPQQEMELVTIELLVPCDHLLGKIDQALDLEFVRERVRHPTAKTTDGRRWIRWCCLSCC